jgi:predicted dehydrogenase
MYLDYNEMIDRADIEVVLILTAPGPHVAFGVKAAEAGKHILVQKPMATTMEGARKIAAAVRKHKVKAIFEPSCSTPLESETLHLRELVRKGVLGDLLWFSVTGAGATSYGPWMGNNVYGQDTFFTKESGGFLFDFPYAPTQIVGILGACKSVMASASVRVAETDIVPEEKYDEFLSGVTDPEQANYWDVVLDLPRTKHIKVEAADNAYSLYEMASGGVGACHAGRIFHPILPGSGDGSLQIFGTEGNLIVGSGYLASIITNRKELLPKVDADGWYHVHWRPAEGPYKWPQPPKKGGFNYYHESTNHLIECILEDRDPLVNVEWGLHITEMMVGAIESQATGRRYEMTTTLDY